GLPSLSSPTPRLSLNPDGAGLLIRPATSFSPGARKLAMTDRFGTKNGGLDPITVEVVRNKLDGIANEMQQTLLRASFSPLVKEGLDASAGLFTARGETLAQALAIPMHLSTLIPVMKTIMTRFPPETMKPGDAYLMNEP